MEGDSITIRQLHQMSQIHYPDSGGNMIDDGQIMGDEKVS